MSIKRSNKTIGNRTLDLPACNRVTQPTALLRAPHIRFQLNDFITKKCDYCSLRIDSLNTDQDNFDILKS
jgi:hypothetical protein